MDTIRAYAAFNMDEQIRRQSSSGAIFSLLAESVLNANGLVYGVAMNKSCTDAEYICVTNKTELQLLLGSKYLQAKVGNIFCDVKKMLESGKEVLFSGTGCQINGLKKFLQKEYTNLLCVDIICHGVPSPVLWRSYVNYMENKIQGELSFVNFRCKDQSWKKFRIKANSNAEEIFIPKRKDPYMQLFLSDFCLRPSCYNCRAKTLRMSDITIGDFWGIESIAPELDDNKGTSLVILRTYKGTDVFNRIRNMMKCQEVSYDEAIQANPAEFRSVYKPKQRDMFFMDFYKMNFYDLQKKYLTMPFKKKIRRSLKRLFNLTRLSLGGTESNADYGLLFVFRV